MDSLSQLKFVEIITCTKREKLWENLMFMGPCIVIIFEYIIPTRCTSHRVYFI